MTALNLLTQVSYQGRDVPGARLRGLLAVLAADLHAGASTSRLVAALWPAEQPANPTKALQVLVSRARARLGADVIASTPTGYRLALADEQVDTAAVLRHAASVRDAPDPRSALAAAQAGLALWDGVTDAPVIGEDPLSSLRAEREHVRRTLVRGRALALARLGRHGEAGPLLAELVGQQPRDEELLRELLRAEAAVAGAPAALARFEAYRRALRDELGTDPGPALQAEHGRLLRAAAPVVRHGVAHEPNPLLGRADDLATVAALLRTSRVTSIVGAGGLGKTRLAHAVARHAEQPMVHLVALAGIAAGGDVTGEVAAALGVVDRAGQVGPPPDTVALIAEAIGGGPALLVLDNCEHVLHGVAALVGALVALTRELAVLTTSRAPLGLSSESVHPLPGLDPATTVELFTQRARAARPGVELPTDAVDALCARLDGLPLAVELAAARVRVLSVPDVLARLENRFTLLRGGTRDAPARHRTLHAVVDWSWNLLDPKDQAAMAALSIFPGGFTADAAAHLISGADVLDVLEHLVDQSLLTLDGNRFRMLETVREFGAAHRDPEGHAVDGLLAWAREFGEAHQGSVFAAAPLAAMQRIRVEQANLSVALQLGIDRADGAAVAATTAALGGLWIVETDVARLLALTARTADVLVRYRPDPGLVEVTRAATTVCAVTILLIRGRRASRQLLALRRLPSAPPDTIVRAFAVLLTGDALGPGPAGPAALSVLCDSIEPLMAGIALGAASYRWEQDGDLDRAVAAAERMAGTLDVRDSPWAYLLAHSRVAELCMQLGRGEQALHHLRAARQVLVDLGERSDRLQIWWGGLLAHLQVGAVDTVERLLAQHARTAPVGAVGLDVEVRAEVALARGDIDSGLRLWRRAVERHRDGDGFGVVPVDRQPWTLEICSVAVVAHARHGRVDLVADLVDWLLDVIAGLLALRGPTPPAYFAGKPLWGAILLALGMVDLDRGAARSGARMVALAERLRFVRQFQPTMSAAAARPRTPTGRRTPTRCRPTQALTPKGCGPPHSPRWRTTGPSPGGTAPAPSRSRRRR